MFPQRMRVTLFVGLCSNAYLRKDRRKMEDCETAPTGMDRPKKKAQALRGKALAVKEVDETASCQIDRPKKKVEVLRRNV